MKKIIGTWLLLFVMSVWAAVEPTQVEVVSGAVSVTGGVTVAGSIAVSNFPTVQVISGTVSTGAAGAQQVYGTLGAVLQNAGTMSVSNFPATQLVLGTLGAILQSPGTMVVSSLPAVSLANSGTMLVSNFPGNQTVNGTLGVILQNTGTVVVSSIPAISLANTGTMSVSNFPATQLVIGTLGAVLQNTGTISVSNLVAVNGTQFISNQLTDFSTEHTLGSVNTAVRGTLFVDLKNEVTAGSMSVTAGQTGTLVIDLTRGYSGLKIHFASTDYSSHQINWFVSPDGATYYSLTCGNVDTLDGQYLYDTGYWRAASLPYTEIFCNVTGYKSFKLTVQAIGADITTQIGIGRQPTLLYGIAGNIFAVDYQWRITGGVDGNPQLTYYSKPVVPATDSIPFPVAGTIGAFQSGTWAIKGTVSLANTGTMAISTMPAVSLANTGTMVVSSLPAIVLANTGTMVVSTLPSVTLANTGTMLVSTVNAGTLNVVSQVATVSSGTLGVVSSVSTLGGGTLGLLSALTGITNTVGVAGTMYQGTSPWVVSHTTGTLNLVSQVNTLSSGTLGVVSSVSTLGGGTLGLISSLATLGGGTLGVLTGITNTVGMAGTVSVSSGTVFASLITGQTGIVGGAGTIGVNTVRSTIAYRPTYSAAISPFTPPATPTALTKFAGNATTTARLYRFEVNCTQTTAGVNSFFLIKRSVVNLGGTLATATAVPHDSADASASSLFSNYINNPASLGTIIGTIAVARVMCPAPASVAPGPQYVFDFNNLGWTPLTLRGTTQTVELNFGGAALPAGLSVGGSAVWTEE